MNTKTLTSEYKKIKNNLDKLLTAKFLEKELEELKDKYRKTWRDQGCEALDTFKRASKELADRIAWILGYQNYEVIPFWELRNQLGRLYDIFGFDLTLSLEKLHRLLKIALKDIRWIYKVE